MSGAARPILVLEVPHAVGYVRAVYLRYLRRRLAVASGSLADVLAQFGDHVEQAYSATTRPGRRARGTALAALLLVQVPPAVAQGGPPADADWRADWELADGLTMQIDTAGYSFPSHIVFVPDPGPGPRDPLYFVIELKGQVKVVANDRSVHTFARDILPNPQGPTEFNQVGLTGLCLDPERGYVFISFAYLDDTQVYRNGMARFTTALGTFGLEATDRLMFLDLFRNERSATSHQIGPCQVKDGQVYVAVGYGDEKAQAQNLHSTLGSILRMTSDFGPVAGNPFYQDDGRDTAIDYVWAYGFRNVFGLKFVGDRLFATENGGDIDRFIEIEKGSNYLWDGTDWGIGARAAQAFAPAIGIVHLDYIASDSTLFPPDLRGQFVAAVGGPPGQPGRSPDGARSVLLLDYDLARRRMVSVPRPILIFRGDGIQVPVSVALGPDGLYFLPILPNAAGVSAVYRITHEQTATIRTGSARTSRRRRSSIDTSAVNATGLALEGAKSGRRWTMVFCRG